jgi:hypothetical protein
VRFDVLYPLRITSIREIQDAFSCLVSQIDHTRELDKRYTSYTQEGPIYFELLKHSKIWRFLVLAFARASAVAGLLSLIPVIYPASACGPSGRERRDCSPLSLWE